MEDRFDQNMNIRKLSFVKNFMIVCLVEKIFDFSHSGSHQGPISAKKRFPQNGGLPEFFFEIFLAPIMYQDLFSNISKIWVGDFRHVGEEVLIHYGSKKKIQK